MRSHRPLTIVILTLAFLSLSTAAFAQTMSFSATLEDLAPGEPQTRTSTFHLDRPASLRGMNWVSRSGILADAIIEVEVCPPVGPCVDPGHSDNIEFSAGELTVRVTATLAPNASVSGTGSARGVLIFSAEAGDDDDLPFTGVDLMETAAWVRP